MMQPYYILKVGERCWAKAVLILGCRVGFRGHFIKKMALPSREAWNSPV